MLESEMTYEIPLDDPFTFLQRNENIISHCEYIMLETLGTFSLHFPSTIPQHFSRVTLIFVWLQLFKMLNLQFFYRRPKIQHRKIKSDTHRIYTYISFFLSNTKSIKMEGINSERRLGLIILMANKGTNPISMALFTLSCTMILNFVATLQDLYSCFRFLLQSFSYFFICTLEKCWSKTGGATSAAAALKPCIHEDDHVKSGITSIKGDIEVVMEKLGISWDSSGDGVDQERILGSGEISNLFDEIEPSLEEVKEAFNLFDGNKDGYIDAKDLEKILCALGFVDYSESECQKMIMALITNNGIGNTRIDFRNFVKIIEDSFT